MSKPLSVPNLLSFIVANLQSESRIKLALSMCGGDCLTEVKVQMAKKDLRPVELEKLLMEAKIDNSDVLDHNEL